MMKFRYYDLIKRPLITEKSTLLSEKNQFVFLVTKNANKINIADVVEYLFSVKVRSVNIVNVKGKQKRFKGRIGFKNDEKKAVVSLQSGYSIDFSGVIK